MASVMQAQELYQICFFEPKNSQASVAIEVSDGQSTRVHREIGGDFNEQLSRQSLRIWMQQIQFLGYLTPSMRST